VYVVQLNSDRIGSTFQPPRAAGGSPSSLETDGSVSVADGGDGIIDPEDEWAGLLGMVSPSPLSPLSPRAPIPPATAPGPMETQPDGYPLSHDFSDDDSVEAEMPSWSPETLPIGGGGVSTTPSPTGFGTGPGSGRRSARSSGSGSSGGRGGGEEDDGTARAAEARAAATAMFSQLPGTTRPQDDDSGCVPAHRCRAMFFNLMILTFYGLAFVFRTGSARGLRLPQNLARG
jgi:hypothetical protein